MENPPRKDKEVIQSFKKSWPSHQSKKSEFAKAKVVYLGHEVGYCKATPKDINIHAVINFHAPHDKRTVRRFLGMTANLTNLLKKGIKLNWDENCKTSFNQLKAVMTSFPVLRSPDFQKPFELSIDASDVGVGAMLTQMDGEGIKHPVAYSF